MRKILWILSRLYLLLQSIKKDDLCKTKKTHSFHLSDVRHLDDPKSDKWMTLAIERVLDKM
jgi:hypothetical protein